LPAAKTKSQTLCAINVSSHLKKKKVKQFLKAQTLILKVNKS